MISATAKAGNHPACIAEIPTISSCTKAAKAALTTKTASMPGDNSPTSPTEQGDHDRDRDIARASGP